MIGYVFHIVHAKQGHVFLSGARQKQYAVNEVTDLGVLFCLPVQFPNKVVAQVACDVLQLLVSYWEKLQIFEPSLPRKIAEVSLFSRKAKM